MCPRSRITFAPFSGHRSVVRKQKMLGGEKKRQERMMSSTYVGESDCQLMMGITVNFYRTQHNPYGQSIGLTCILYRHCPRASKGIRFGLLDLCNLLQNPCVTFTFPFCRRITKLQIAVGKRGTVSLHTEGPCVGGGGLLCSALSP